MAGTRYTGQAPLDLSRLHESFGFQIIPGRFPLCVFCFFPPSIPCTIVQRVIDFLIFFNDLATPWHTLQQNQAGTTLHHKPMPFEEGPSGLGPVVPLIPRIHVN